MSSVRPGQLRSYTLPSGRTAAYIVIDASVIDVVGRGPRLMWAVFADGAEFAKWADSTVSSDKIVSDAAAEERERP